MSYLGMFLLGWVLPSRTPGQRLLRGMSLWAQLPVGVAIYSVPEALITPLVFVRFSFFVAALALVAKEFGPSTPAGSDALA